MNECVHESRVLKETESIAKLIPEGSEIIIAAANKSDLPVLERLDAVRSIRRETIALPWFITGKLKTIIYFPLWILVILWRYLPRKPHVVNVHHAETLFLGFLFKILAGSKLIYDPHELEAEKNGYGKVKKKLISFVEKVFVPFANEIFVVNKSISEEYVKRYQCKAPHVLMNVPKLSRQSGHSKPLRESLCIPADKKICLYLGGLMRGRGIELILEAFSTEFGPDYVVVFVGYGPLQSLIQAYANRNSRIYFYPAVQPEEVLKVAASADVGLCLIESVSLSYFYCLPNKFFEYLFAGIPVVVSPLPEMLRLVNQYKVGVVLGECSAESMFSAISAAAFIDKTLMQEKVELIRAVYSWDAQEDVLESVYGKYF